MPTLLASVRSHPFVGSLLLIIGVGLLIVGALSPVGEIASSPLPKEVVFPFIFWQLAAWCLLLGASFMRKRAPRVAAVPRPKPAR